MQVLPTAAPVSLNARTHTRTHTHTNPHTALDKVVAHCSDAVAKGARVLAGGGKPEGMPDKNAGGNFFEPTVLADATIDM